MALWALTLTLATLGVGEANAAAVATPVGERASSELLGLDLHKKKLTFDSNGHFKVVSFSDMHFGERWGNGSWAEWGPANDASTQRVHGVVLDQEKPNYVVYNGDMVTGENLFADNATAYLDLVYGPATDRKIPFSSAHGNHDNANNINHQIIVEYEQKHFPTLSYTRADVGPKPWGVGNYWVPVYENELSSTPSLIMWFFDSRSFVSGTGNGPGPVPESADKYWVDEKSVPPYIDRQAGLMKTLWGSVPPSLVFFHIPLQKAQLLYQLPTPGDHDDGNPSTQGFYNNTYTGLDLPFFQALTRLNGGLKRGKVLAMTSGHDHGESWCARSTNSSGIPLCFNGHSGYGGYVTTHSVVRNGRVFDLDIKKLKETIPSVDTWNSYEDKTTNEHVTLGPDFMDEYV
ncbi:Metallo-dependent phosphatase-like protein [Flagelloscypha sp. PMI_526]|nr:Metallo-dependent phosphatase-like protein [Flagelloscypha sp. PMI_526]